MSTDQDNRALIRQSGGVALGTAASRVTGLLRIVVLTWAIGQTNLTDIFNLANVGPNLIYELAIGGVLSATLVPLFVQLRKASDEETASIVSSSLVLLFGALTVAVLLLAHLGVGAARALEWGGDRTELQFRIFLRLLDFILPQVFFYGLITLATARLNSTGSFVAPAWTPAAGNLVSSGFFLAAGLRAGESKAILGAQVMEPGVLALLGIGATAGIALSALLLVPSLRSSGSLGHFRPRLRHHSFAELRRLSGWTLGYVAVNQLTFLFIYGTNASLRSGGPSMYVNAYTFFQLPHGLIAVSIMTTTMPSLAAAFVDDDPELFRNRFLRGLTMMMSAILPAAAGLAALAHPLIATMLQRGAFNERETSVTAFTLAAFAVGLPGFSLYLYCLRGFYARKNTRTPFYMNLIQNATNVVLIVTVTAVLSGGASSRWGIPAMALAYATSYTVAGLVAARALNQDVGATPSRAMDISAVPELRAAGSTLARLGLAALLMGGALAALLSLVSPTGVTQSALALIVGSLGGGSLYLVLSNLLGAPDLGDLLAELPGPLGTIGRALPHRTTTSSR